MVIFHCYVNVYQRVTDMDFWGPSQHRDIASVCIEKSRVQQIMAAMENQGFNPQKTQFWGIMDI